MSRFKKGLDTFMGNMDTNETGPEVIASDFP